MGTSASCQGSKGADIGETCSRKQTSGLKLQTDIRAYTIQTSLAGRTSHGQCGSVRRSTHSHSSLRSYNELLYSHAL